MKNYNYLLITLLFAMQFYAQPQGCTDVLAQNYNASAVINNGSCTYAQATVFPDTTVQLPGVVSETSGLALWNGYLYTHNDSNDSSLYALDTLTASINQIIALPGVVNYDWEDITHDSEYFYVGDFGNNANGNRQNLRIIKVRKSTLSDANPEIDYINFTYSNQTDFTPAGGNSTNFDCEAFIATQDSLYLFTKQWVSRQTSVYALPKTAGSYSAELKTTYNVDGLITGAACIENKKLIVLIGYSTLLQPFFYLLYDFNANDFFSGNKRKVNISAPFHQTEGIATTDGLHYFVSNERFIQAPFVNVQPKLGYYDLSAFLENYLSETELGSQTNSKDAVMLYPNPTDGTLHIVLRDDTLSTGFEITDMAGKTVMKGILRSKDSIIDISALQDGVYMFSIDMYKGKAWRLVKES